MGNKLPKNFRISFAIFVSRLQYGHGFSRQKIEKAKMFDKMDLLFLSFTLLFWTSFVNVNGYAFDGSRSTFFAFSNTEMPMDELKQLGNRLYLENSEKLSVVCCLVDKKNWSLSRSKELAKKYAAGGLLPYITFKNKTWWKTYKFPAQNGIPSVHWRLEISRDKFSRGKRGET